MCGVFFGCGYKSVLCPSIQICLEVIPTEPKALYSQENVYTLAVLNRLRLLRAELIAKEKDFLSKVQSVNQLHLITL